MKNQRQFWSILGLITLLPLVVYGQSVSITDISPPSPAHLTPHQKVSVQFTYSIPKNDGVRIFLRPITSGRLTPNYTASGSPIYRGDRGTGTANFTISSGNPTINQLRIQVLSQNKDRLLFEFFIPVDFKFTSSAHILNPTIKNKITSLKLLAKGHAFPADTSKSIPTSKNPTIIKRTVKPDGTIEVHYSDGSITGDRPSGSDYIITIKGDTLFTTRMEIEVQGASKPASPPGSLTAADVDETWLISLNNWIEYLGSQLLNNIQLLLNDEESFRNYQQFEEENSSTIYEKVNLRYTFLEKLLKL